ncbi:MAG: hypothetical protein HQM11_09415 [SAR324 cluster bacterium]|nr:hypothetical protein [SAR324 cluster bacterium]
MKIYLLLAMFLIPLSGFAQSNTAISATAYVSSMTFDNSLLKDSAIQTGVYLYVGQGLNNVFEGAVDYYSQSNLPVTVGGVEYAQDDLTQTDYSFAYNNYGINSVKIRVGAHYIDTSHDATDGGYVLFTGANYYVPLQWNFGVDVYQSVYPNFEVTTSATTATTSGTTTSGTTGTSTTTTTTNPLPPPNTPPPAQQPGPAGQPRLLEPVLIQTTETVDFTVTQITPTLGLSFFDAYLYSETQLNYIMLGSDSGLDEDTWISLKEALSWYTGSWTFSGFVWGGSQVYAVTGGFTVVNSPEEKTGGWGASVKFVPTDSSSVTLAMDQTSFKDLLDERMATATGITLTGGYSF